MNDIVVRPEINLPSTFEDLSRFVLVGREKLVAVRAEIRAIDKVGLAKEVREQKLQEAQFISEAVLDASVRIGELMQAVPKATAYNNPSGEKRKTTQNDSGVDLGSAKKKSEVIKEAGFTPKQVERFQQMAANPELVEQVKAEAKENGDIASQSAVMEKIKEKKRAKNEAKREEKRQENAQKVATLSSPLEAQGLFQTIVIDPAWDWGDEGDINQFGRAKPDYYTMSIEQVEALPINKIADKNCHLYLWITNRSLPKGFRLLEAWGFRYVTCLTWIKPSFGMGNYFRGQTEQILFGVKGSQGLKRHDVGTCFNAPRGEKHSAKPDEFYSLVESCSYAPYIDIFGRKERTGWTVWGEDA